MVRIRTVSLADPPALLYMANLFGSYGEDQAKHQQYHHTNKGLEAAHVILGVHYNEDNAPNDQDQEEQPRNPPVMLKNAPRMLVTWKMKEIHIQRPFHAVFSFIFPLLIWVIYSFYKYLKFSSLNLSCYYIMITAKVVHYFPILYIFPWLFYRFPEFILLIFSNVCLH